MSDYRADLIDLAEEIEQEIVESIDLDENPACELCGTKRFAFELRETDATHGYYKREP